MKNSQTMLDEIKHDQQREKDIQAVCNHIVNSYIEDTGDSGTGGCCPFCGLQCRHDAENVSKIQHKPDCIYLIAKDLLT